MGLEDFLERELGPGHIQTLFFLFQTSLFENLMYLSLLTKLFLQFFMTSILGKTSSLKIN